MSEKRRPDSDAGPPARLLTPSKITAWLDCPHYLTLKHQAERGGVARRFHTVGSFAELLMEKGLEHEATVEAAYVDAGLTVHRVDGKGQGETFADWAERVAGLLDTDVDVLFQMPLVHDGIRGVADFLEREVDAETGSVSWEPVDAKLARRAAKPGHVLQLCFYAEALGAATGEVPLRLQVSLGSGTTEAVGYESVRPYWARLRCQLASVMAEGPGPETRPEPCDHCGFCEFQSSCEAVWREEDSLVYVSGTSKIDRMALDAAGVSTMAALATRTEPVAQMRDERLSRLRVQAELQVGARERPEEPPPYRLIPAGEDPVWGRGFERMPEPSGGDIFLDFEGHPFWRPDRGLFFLFGYVARGADGEWHYHQAWAHDENEERERVRELIHDIRDRRAANPGMHVYHYNHTERSALESMAAEHGVAQRTLDSLIDAQVFVDLFPVVRNSIQVGVESYSLKYLELLTGPERSHEIDKGAGAVLAYEAFIGDGDEDHLRAIAAYNDDDVRATRALRNWLLQLRPHELEWRADPEPSSEDADEIDQLIEDLAAFGEGTPQHLMSGLLGYWRREWRAHIAPLIGRLDADEGDLLEDAEVLAGLHGAEEFERIGKKAKPLAVPGLRLRIPPQNLARAFTESPPSQVIFTSSDGLLCFVSVDRIDIDEGVLELSWNDSMQELGEAPTAVVANDWVGPSTKWDVLVELARQLRDPTGLGAPSTLTKRLLEREGPVFRGSGPPAGVFRDDPNELAELVVRLDQSVLGVQGPPGTGKTYRGAQIAKALVAAGKRVGIMAMSHHAIDNFLEEIVEVFDAEPRVELRAIRKVIEVPQDGLPGVTYVKNNNKLGSGDFDIVAGTSWMFAAKTIREAPVDVLLIDEAGQLALIDAAVSSVAAESMVLLGDPLQLPQVAQATHPGESGASALGHILGDEATIPSDRGVFIEETRRMHPDVCRFISDRIYEGRLSSHSGCAIQTTDAGTGLRWLGVEHEGCSTDSEEEATAVAAQVQSLLGRNWTDKDGFTRPITTADMMVVAPYNDQVRLLRRHLWADPMTQGIEVGTVDKFQGRQAPVVFFTMTSSSADEMPRGTEFLFSRNRLNVAISRAQCTAYLVCTEELLNSRAKTVEDMLLIATLCAFVEYAEVVT
ncbi:MAG: TM0106 family RecB-like putative nuclease [bacterium]|nr:TM0106 family RecB-like putative nuclease [bacterium]